MISKLTNLLKKHIWPFKLEDSGFKFFAKFCFAGALYGGISGAVLVASVIAYFSFQVPNYESLSDYKPSVITKIYAQDARLVSEYAKQRRLYIPIEDVPKSVIEAFLAAEDTSFFEHHGFKIKAIVRAALTNILTGRKQGASTITQQVAKTFLLSSEKTYTRKIKEVILAWRIEKSFTKDEILELYLNQIYLGNGAYGIAAAAQAYYGKTLEELTLGQRAMIAGLPKAPSAYNPVRKPRVARLRRDVIIKRMEAEGFVTPEQAKQAIATDLELNPQPLKSGIAEHFSEHVRRTLSDKYGDKELYNGGLSVMTTLNMEMQEYAEHALYKGLRDYDRRHGYRGPIGRLALLLNWQTRVDDEYKAKLNINHLGVPAAVLQIDDAKNFTQIGLPEGKLAELEFATMKWAREYIDVDKRGPRITKPSDVVRVGDIIWVKPLNETIEYEEGKYSKIASADEKYAFEQIPEVQGALVAMDVKTGAVRAMVGGIDSGNGFNRAVQAKRQVGSSFKPFVYAAAMEKGFTPASIVLDAPVVLRNTELDEAWKPQNYSTKVYGPSTLRRGLEKSRNLMTIRLAREVGLKRIINVARRVGMSSDLEYNLSTALGSGSMTLLENTSSYATIANKGDIVTPYFIERIQDRVGNTIFSAQPTCFECTKSGDASRTLPPSVIPKGDNALDPAIAYQIVSMLEGTVRRGTGWRAKAVGKTVGIKTGTTNDSKDAWYMGFSPTLAVGVWVGFDNPKTLGGKETGSSAAGPIWTDFMKQALKDEPNRTFPVPEGITFVRVDAETGALPTVNTKKTILEAFVTGTEPKSKDLPSSIQKWRDNGDQSKPKVEFNGIY